MTDRRTPHKHAAAIKAWADGATIQWKYPESTGWADVVGSKPFWDERLDYRVKPAPHKWQKEMDAQAAGKVVQYRMAGSKNWIDRYGNRPWNFDAHTGEYRIKPELVVRYGVAKLSDSDPASAEVKYLGNGNLRSDNNLKLLFEDGKLIGAEVLNG